MTQMPRWGLVVIPLALGCGRTSGANYNLDVGSDDGGPPFGFSGTDGGQGLDAYIEQGHIAVTFITLSCSGPCADVQAVATGGNAPYRFVWEDGSTSAMRHVCPTSSTNYRVTVSDSGMSGEFFRAPETTTVPLSATVMACPDGGIPACVSNPSFEGTAVSEGVDAAPWVTCTSGGVDTAITNQSIPGYLVQLPAPTDGNTYLGLTSSYGNGVGTVGAVSEPLCAVMHAGVAYSLELDVVNGSGLGLTPTALEIFGASSSCTQAQLLWTSPVAGTSWSTFCATFTPTQGTTYLTLTLAAPANGTTPSSAFFVDHLVPVTSCP
jgi:hypothetical protein